MVKRSDFLVGLDIGTTEVRCAIGLAPLKEGDNIQILGVGTAKSDGLRRGVIAQPTDVIEAIQAAVEQAEVITGHRVRNLTVNVNGSHLSSMVCRDEVGVSNVERRVVDQDIKLLHDKVKSGRVGSNETLVQFFPREYRLDDQRNIKNPQDLSGKVLGLEALLVKGSTTHVESIEKVCAALDLRINNLAVSSLAAWEAIFDKRVAESGIAVIDIGASTTNLIVVREGEVEHVASIPIGGSQLTNDLAIGLKVSLEVAEEVKVKYVDVSFKGRGTKTIRTRDQEFLFNPSVAATIARDRLEEVAARVLEEFKKAQCLDRLPGGVFLAGGGAQLAGLPEFLRDELSLAVQPGKLRKFDGLVDEIRKNPQHLVATGLMALDFVLSYQNRTPVIKVWQTRFKLFFDRVNKFVDRIKKLRS